MALGEAVMAGQPRFFDLDARYAAVSAAGDPLVRLGELVDFALFRPRLVRALRRSAVAHVFAHQKGAMTMCVRTIGIGRARARIGMANLAFNMRRFVWLERRPAPA